MKLKLSELFYSLQGEGRYIGVPSIFMRTFGCNFTCSGFGMPRGEVSQERKNINPVNFTSYKQLPLVSTGCDSYASWDPRFKHLSNVYEVSEIAGMMSALLPERLCGKFGYRTTEDIHLVITGGEPLLGWQRAYPELLDKLHQEMNLDYVTFETNGTQPLTPEFESWMLRSKIKFTYSISPKLSASGERYEDAIRPDVVSQYMSSIEHQNEVFENLYLKFVVDDTADVVEIHRAIIDYEREGIVCPIYLMPVGGTGHLYYQNNTNVARMAMDNGWRYSPRIQVDLWKNAWGT